MSQYDRERFTESSMETIPYGGMNFMIRIKEMIYGDTMDKSIITSKYDLDEFLKQDARANYRTTIRCRSYNDEIWRFLLLLRKTQYYDFKRKQNYLFYIPFIYFRRSFQKKALKLGFSISWTTQIGKGFSIPHYGSIVIHPKAVIGDNFKCHVGVNIGASNGNHEPPIIGNNVYAGPGVKIVGNISIADDVALGAGAVVVKSIYEAGTTWVGVPARKISDNSSHIHMSPMLVLKR